MTSESRAGVVHYLTGNLFAGQNRFGQIILVALLHEHLMYVLQPLLARGYIIRW